jgi:hypothetical protein
MLRIQGMGESLFSFYEELAKKVSINLKPVL